ITGVTEWNEQIPQLRLVDVLNGDAGEWKPQEPRSGITKSLCDALRRIGVVNTDKITNRSPRFGYNCIHQNTKRTVPQPAPDTTRGSRQRTHPRGAFPFVFVVNAYSSSRSRN
ncbi:MAG: hypothetical protein WAN54_19435, partial [Syntrophobacteraceae bacterium]